MVFFFCAVLGKWKLKVNRLLDLKFVNENTPFTLSVSFFAVYVFVDSVHSFMVGCVFFCYVYNSNTVKIPFNFQHLLDIEMAFDELIFV